MNHRQQENGSADGDRNGSRDNSIRGTRGMQSKHEWLLIAYGIFSSRFKSQGT
jgi:hypothetical protein